MTYVHEREVCTMHAPNDRIRSSVRRRLSATAPRTRSVLLATGLLVVVLAPFGVAATGDSLREGRRNGTTTVETEIISNIKSSTALKGGYSTRQSNLSDSGGGAIYGCRSQAGGSKATPTPQNPCLRANNLSRGLAFEFQATIGDLAGTISVGAGGDTKKPFTTNATGVATGLNADRLDSLDAPALIAQAREGLVEPFAHVSSGGDLGERRGTQGAAPVTHVDDSGVYAVLFTGDLSKCAVSATITGTAFGEITATPVLAGGNTTVTVRTANSAGVAADRPFHVNLSC
jgi:hypothetical protein